MSKTNIFLIVFIILLLGGVIGGGAYFFYNRNQNQKGTGEKTSVGDLLPFKKKATADKTYTDEAGFSFSYPKDVTVEDVTPEDGKAYSVLTLTYQEKVVTLQALETSYKTVEDWLAKDKSAPKGVTLVGATTLGAVSAKQYSLGDKLMTVAVDQGVVYLIEGPQDGDYMEDTQNLLVSTFAFADMESNTPATTNVVYEEEEVVE